MWFDYIKERTDKSVKTIGNIGFATYFVRGNSMYIEDIYVKPEYRKSGVASKLADEIAEEAKEQDLKYLLGSVDPNTKGCTGSLKTLLAYGFELLGIEDDLIFFKKDL